MAAGGLGPRGGAALDTAAPALSTSITLRTRHGSRCGKRTPGTLRSRGGRQMTLPGAPDTLSILPPTPPPQLHSTTAGCHQNTIAMYSRHVAPCFAPPATASGIEDNTMRQQPSGLFCHIELCKAPWQSSNKSAVCFLICFHNCVFVYAAVGCSCSVFRCCCWTACTFRHQQQEEQPSRQL